MAKNDFQYGGHPPSWIFEICHSFHVIFVSTQFCFIVQNIAEIGQ